jgi:enamine deaminase RidA (YjgF/YER057c/UK114 family)
LVFAAEGEAGMDFADVVKTTVFLADRRTEERLHTGLHRGSGFAGFAGRSRGCSGERGALS